MSEPSYLEHFRWTNGAEELFFETLARLGSVVDACRKIGCSRSSAYQRKKDDEGFAARWEFALEVAVARLEKHAWKRATGGVVEETTEIIDAPDGRTIKTKRVKRRSNTLLMRLLEAHSPRYRVKPNGTAAPVNVNIVNVITDANNAARERAKALRAGGAETLIEHQPSGDPAGDGGS